jgi:hypothetical protein
MTLLEIVGADREERDLLRLARPAIDDAAAVEPTHEADGTGVHVAQKR